MIIKVSVFAEMFTFFTPATIGLVLEDRDIIQRDQNYDVICDRV